VDQREGVLTARTTAILRLIAEGRSYDQILLRHPELTYLDIFSAAREALNLLVIDERTTPTPVPSHSTESAPFAPPPSDTDDAPGLVEEEAGGEVVAVGGDASVEPAPRRPSFVERARQQHGRAFTRWSRDEDARLQQLFQDGVPPAEIGQALDRHDGAVWRRLLKLGLVTESALPVPVASRGRRSPDRATQPSSLEAIPLDRSGSHTVVEPKPTSEVVPGWETFRDRLR
jgi:hypothetical protein